MASSPNSGEEMATKKKTITKWPDGRAKVWFEAYFEKSFFGEASTLARCVKIVKDVQQGKGRGISVFKHMEPAIYEVHSLGGWDTMKEDKAVKVWSVINGVPKKRQFKKGW
jgi:hypothetical protein